MEEKTGRDTLTDMYPSNSRATRKEREENVEKKLEKVVSGTVKTQKRSLFKRITDTFMEDSTKSVGGYIFHDVLVPAVKSAICDIVGWGGFAEMILFGDRRSRGNRPGSSRSHISYWSASNNNNSSLVRDRDNRDRDRRELSRAARARHDFDEIVFETRGEAEEVLSHMVDQIEEYRQVTVADLFDLAGVHSNFTDNKYGWDNLSGVKPRRVPGGYILDLPRPQLLDD